MTVSAGTISGRGGGGGECARVWAGAGGGLICRRRSGIIRVSQRGRRRRRVLFVGCFLAAKNCEREREAQQGQICR